jgi:glycosyltransferase involved in cell wall biosynthesis
VFQSFSARASKILNNRASREATFLLSCDTKTPTELELLKAIVGETKSTQKDGNSADADRLKLSEKLLSNEKIRVGFINDNGFYAGAGIALARQARSFALAGHQVSVVGLNPYPETALSTQRYKSWLKQEGCIPAIKFYAVRKADCQIGRNGDNDYTDVISTLYLQELWDLVILGNLHSDAISLRFLEPILHRNIPIVYFSHDLDLLGGGCGYPQYYECTQYLNGCLDSTCPKPQEAYPKNASGRVAINYMQRTLLFECENVSLACNSYWSQQHLMKRYLQKPVLPIHCSIDTSIFCPVADKASLRETLGLHPTCFTVVIGADSLSRPGKGGELLEFLVPCLVNDPDIQVVSLGHYPASQHEVKSFGYLDNETDISRVFASGDCYLNPVTIEALGQTILEASACGCIPIVLRRAGGVVDAIKHGRTGFIVDEAQELLDSINLLKKNENLRQFLADEGCEWIRQHFSLQRQYCCWLEAVCSDWFLPSRRQHLRVGNAIEKAVSDQEPPIVSVVSLTLNCAEALAITATSLQMQDHSSFEWIIQDGGSADNTLSVAKAADVPCRIYQDSDTGIYDAANRSIGHCQGEWVLFLHAGDWLAGPKALSKVMSSVELCQTDLIVTDFMEILIDGTIHRRHPSNPADKLRHLSTGSFQAPGPHWLSNMPSHQGMILRRKWLEQFPFSLDLKISADWLQMFSVIDAGAKVGMSGELLSWYSNGGFSFENSDQWIRDVISIAKKFCSNHQAVDAYFADALERHRQTCYQRRRRRLALNRLFPSGSWDGFASDS